MKKRPSRVPPRAEPRDDAFLIDDEAAAFAGELIEEATSAEYIGEDARNEVLEEESSEGAYLVDFTVLDDEPC